MAVAVGKSWQLADRGDGRGDMGGRAFSYIGIPYPTEPVPSQIVTTHTNAEISPLPTGADFNNHEWIGTYDPILVPTPTPTPGGAPTEWVCNYLTGNDVTAGQGGQGTTDAPRESLPSASQTFPAGTKIFVYGDGTPRPTSINDNRKIDYNDWTASSGRVEMQGTSSNPCWIVGIDNPRLEVHRASGITSALAGSTHTIVDGIVFENGGNRGPSFGCEDSDYTCIRNCGYYGDGDVFNGAGVISVNRTNFHVFYNNECRYMTTGSAQETHIWRPQKNARWSWVIDSTFAEMQDGIQMGPSGGSWGGEEGPQDRVHYTWVGGCEFFNFDENAIDLKNNYHMVASQNCIHSPRGLAGSPPTFMIWPNNDEGFYCAYFWAVANTLEGPDLGSSVFRYDQKLSGGFDGLGGISAAISNLIFNVPGADAFSTTGQQPGGTYYTVNNTVYQCDIAYVDGGQGDGSGHTQLYYGNIIHTAAGIDDGANQAQTEMVDNIHHNVASFTLDNVNVYANNPEDDPLFVDAAGGDFSLQVGSPARNLTTEHPVYQLFENLYGQNIRFDVNGKPRPSSGPWDSGAIQSS